MITTTPFADMIRHRRKQLEITLGDLARAVRLTIPQLSAFERGVIDPPGGTTLLALAMELHLDVRDLQKAARETPRIDPRDAELEQLRARVVELESALRAMLEPAGDTPEEVRAQALAALRRETR